MLNSGNIKKEINWITGNEYLGNSSGILYIIDTNNGINITCKK